MGSITDFYLNENLGDYIFNGANFPTNLLNLPKTK